jgi:hypothetical protein
VNILTNQTERKGRNQTLTRIVAAFLVLGSFSVFAWAQGTGADSNRPADPDEIRGYKVAHASVSVKRGSEPKPETGAPAPPADNDSDAMVQVGEPKLVSIRPFGITFEVPITVAALDKGGTVDFLTFEDIKVNGSSVSIEEFQQKFDIPNKKAAGLPAPIKVFISTPTAMLGALYEWRNAPETWPISGRVYVFGRFKKFIFKVKRVVPIDFNLTIANPLRSAPATSDTTTPANPAIKH